MPWYVKIAIGFLIGFFFASVVRFARAEALPERPQVIEKLPTKAADTRKRDCRVVIGRGSIFMRATDGTIVPLAVFSERRTRC